jgi:alpha-beta hydrolase superfamily lysophospholipase
MLNHTDARGHEPPRMAPRDILPYYFAVEPSPTDARTAFAVAEPTVNGIDVGVSIVLEDRDICTEVFRFSRLGFVKIAWSPCGRFLAFAQGSTLMVRDPGGTLRLSSLVGDIQWLGFDRQTRLWCLAGGRLEARLDQGVLAETDGVECAAADHIAAYCRRLDAGIGIYLHDGTHEREFARLPDLPDQVSVDLSLHGYYLIVVRASARVRDRMRAQIIRFDLAISQMATLLDERVSFGFNGGPGINAKILGSGEVLAAYENGACTQISSLTPGVPAKPISPAGFEVFDFILDANGRQIAIIASDTRDAAGVFDRQILFGFREPEGWRFSPPVPGVHEMPRWKHNGHLEALCGRDGRWTRRIHAPGAAELGEGSSRREGLFLAVGSTDYDFLRLAGSKSRRAGIILLPRLHQQFVAGAQPFFFHHLLFSVARGLAMDGFTVAVLNGPGALGKGRSRREPAHSYLAQLQSSIDDLARFLREDGCLSIGILAGSLAAVSALRFCGPRTPFSAGAFVTPLFEASIPVTWPVRHHLLDDPFVEPLDAAAEKVEVPVLIVHGARDEVVPSGQIAQFSKLTSRVTQVEMCVLEEEGHIFKLADSWRKAQNAIENFFSSHLAADGVCFSRSASRGRSAM